MKLAILSGAIALALFAKGAAAACAAPAVQVTDVDLVNLLTNNTVCASLGQDTWQEEHRAGGSLVDFKRGPNHPIDPTKQVGTWQASGANVTYTYTAGDTFTFQVWNNGGGSYSFCGATTIDFSIRNGIGIGCGIGP